MEQVQEKIEMLKKLKARLSVVKKGIESLEQSLISETPNLKLEGVNKLPWGTITTKLNRKVDIKKYFKIHDQLPHEYKFMSAQPKMSLSVLRMAESTYPELVHTCITTKPGKAVIKIKEAGDES